MCQIFLPFSDLSEYPTFKNATFKNETVEIDSPHRIAFCDTYVQQLLVSDPCGCPSFVGPSTFDALRWEFQMQYFSIKFLSLLLSEKQKNENIKSIKCWWEKNWD